MKSRESCKIYRIECTVNGQGFYNHNNIELRDILSPTRVDNLLNMIKCPNPTNDELLSNIKISDRIFGFNSLGQTFSWITRDTLRILERETTLKLVCKHIPIHATYEGSRQILIKPKIWRKSPPVFVGYF